MTTARRKMETANTAKPQRSLQLSTSLDKIIESASQWQWKSGRANVHEHMAAIDPQVASSICRAYCTTWGTAFAETTGSLHNARFIRHRRDALHHCLPFSFELIAGDDLGCEKEVVQAGSAWHLQSLLGSSSRAVGDKWTESKQGL